MLDIGTQQEDDEFMPTAEETRHADTIAARARNWSLPGDEDERDLWEAND